MASPSSGPGHLHRSGVAQDECERTDPRSHGTEVARDRPHSTPAALDEVRAGAADFACVPIENSIEGGVLPTLDSLATGLPLQIYAEITLDVAFSIVTRSSVASDQIRTVAAFPVAAAQVRRWLAANLPHARLVPANSDAAAAQDVAAGRRRRRVDSTRRAALSS